MPAVGLRPSTLTLHEREGAHGIMEGRGRSIETGEPGWVKTK